MARIPDAEISGSRDSVTLGLRDRAILETLYTAGIRRLELVTRS